MITVKNNDIKTFYFPFVILSIILRYWEAETSD